MGKRGESPKAAALFAEYCNLGPTRSLAKLAAYLGKGASYKRQLEVYSSAYSWQARVRLFDAEQAEEVRKLAFKEREEKRRKWEEERERMDQEHALLGRTHALRAAQQIKDLIDAKSLGSQATVMLFKYATDLERIARGAATENVKTSNTTETSGTVQHNVLAFDLSKLTLAQLERLEQLAEEVSKQQGEDKNA